MRVRLTLDIDPRNSDERDDRVLEVRMLRAAERPERRLHLVDRVESTNEELDWGAATRGHWNT